MTQSTACGPRWDDWERPPCERQAGVTQAACPGGKPSEQGADLGKDVRLLSPVTCFCSVSYSGGHLDNSTQWIISPSYLLREFCTFEGYVILEIKLNARLRWAHLACRWRLATGAERRDAARARPWEQMALKRIVQVQCMEIIHLDEQMKSADLLLQSFEDNERFLCIRLEACDPKGHFALSVLSRQPVKDGWSEPSVRSGIQETPAGS